MEDSNAFHIEELAVDEAAAGRFQNPGQNLGELGGVVDQAGGEDRVAGCRFLDSLLTHRVQAQARSGKGLQTFLGPLGGVEIGFAFTVAGFAGFFLFFLLLAQLVGRCKSGGFGWGFRLGLRGFRLGLFRLGLFRRSRGLRSRLFRLGLFRRGSGSLFLFLLILVTITTTTLFNKCFTYGNRRRSGFSNRLPLSDCSSICFRSTTHDEPRLRGRSTLRSSNLTCIIACRHLSRHGTRRSHLGG